jgi:hypothetical protein
MQSDVSKFIFSLIMEQQSPDNVVTSTTAHADGRQMGARLHGGYRVREYGGKQYIVPDFLAPSTEQALAAINEKEKIGVDITCEVRYLLN